MVSHCFFKTEFNIILLSAFLVQVTLLSSDFPSEVVYTFLISSYQLWYISHPLHRPLIVLITVVEGHKLWCYSLCTSVVLLLPVSYIQIFPVPYTFSLFMSSTFSFCVVISHPSPSHSRNILSYITLTEVSFTSILFIYSVRIKLCLSWAV